MQHTTLLELLRMTWHECLLFDFSWDLSRSCLSRKTSNHWHHTSCQRPKKDKLGCLKGDKTPRCTDRKRSIIPFYILWSYFWENPSTNEKIYKISSAFLPGYSTSGGISEIILGETKTRSFRYIASGAITEPGGQCCLWTGVNCTYENSVLSLNQCALSHWFWLAGFQVATPLQTLRVITRWMDL